MWLYKKRRKEKTTWKKGEKATTTTTAPGLCTLTVVCLYIHSREWSAIMEHTMHVCVPLLCLLFLGEERLLFSSCKDEDKKQIEIQIQY